MTDEPKIKYPRNKTEERTLKEGLVEDDNEDIAYLNFNILWPVSAAAIFSIVFFGLTVGLMDVLPHHLRHLFAVDQVWLSYGRQHILCSNSMEVPPGTWPSILRQVEIKVLSNVFFRIAVCVPMAIRIFVAIIARYTTIEDADEEIKKGKFFQLCNNVSAIAAVVEVFSQALFAIVTIRLDFPAVYQTAFTTFTVTSVGYMYIRTFLLFAVFNRTFQNLDYISLALKGLSIVTYSWTMSQFFSQHIAFIHKPTCHGYVPPGQALVEYVMLLSYFIFHLTSLIDVRYIRFLCYPRTCSGECEPLKPENFQPNHKYQYCRSFEYRQRQIIGQNF